MTEKRYYFVGEKSKQNQAVIELVESWRSEEEADFVIFHFTRTHITS